MAVDPDSPGVRFPPPLVYLAALLLGLAAERVVALRFFGVDWRLLAATGALLFVVGAAITLAATGLFRRLGTKVRPVAANNPHRNHRSLSVDPQSHVSRNGTHVRRPCDWV